LIQTERYAGSKWAAADCVNCESNHLIQKIEISDLSGWFQA
jgi:hypothetical protein